jgi:hypothetical protein
MIRWSSSYAADRITISYSSRTYAFLPAEVAVAKSFFKDENLFAERVAKGTAASITQ